MEKLNGRLLVARSELGVRLTNQELDRRGFPPGAETFCESSLSLLSESHMKRLNRTD